MPCRIVRPSPISAIRLSIRPFSTFILSSDLLTCCLNRYTANRQPGKALPYFLRLRRPNVFELIREHNLFTAVQDQALLLVEFDQEIDGEDEKGRVAG